MRAPDFDPSTLVCGETFAGRVTYAGRSLAGGRTNNEDDFLCAPGLGLFAVADGMGGHNAGEVASALALETLGDAFREQTALPLVVLAHVGDSRIYRLRGHSLVQLTDDHAVPQTPHLLTRAIGTFATIGVDTHTLRVEPDDVLLLCTDGVPNALLDPLLARVLGTARRTAATAVDAILRAAMRDANDNLTAVVLRIEGRS